jgi:hypothetical protein
MILVRTNHPCLRVGHHTYLCLKVPALLGVILIDDSQKDARNIEQGFAPGHRNVNCLEEEEEEAEGRHDTSTTKSEASIVSRQDIEPECKTKRVPLDPRVPDKALMISQDLSIEEETELLSFLDKISDVFTWKTSNLMGGEQKHN